MDLVERDRETTFLEKAFTEAFAGRPKFAVIDGGTGSGKTELIHYAAGLAAEARVPHLRATNSPMSASEPFGVVRRLLHQAPAVGSVDPAVTRRLEDLAREASVAERQRPPQAPAPPVLGGGLASALAEIARETPLLVTIDDIHHADASSLDLLQQVIGDWRGGGLILVLSRSLHCPPSDPLFHVETLRSRLYTRLRLQPLSEDGIRRLLSSHLGAARADRLAADYAHATGGNPLLLRCLIEDVKRATAPGDTIAAGREYQQSVLACLRRCSATTVEVARAAAVLTSSRRLRSAAPLLLKYMFDGDPRQVEQSLCVLEEVGILDPKRTFRLDAARTAILGDLPADRYRDLMVRAIHAMHLSPGENRRHEAAPTILGDASSGRWTVGLLLDAAEAELAQDETSGAIAHLELALDLCADDTARSRVVAALARAKWHIDPLTAGQHLDYLLDAYRNDDLAPRDSVTLMHQLAWHGSVEAVAEMVERSCDEGAADRRSEVHSAHQLLMNTFPPLKSLADRLPEDPPAELHTRVPLTGVRARAGSLLAGLLAGGPRTEAVNTAQQLLKTTRLSGSTFETLDAALLILLYSEHFAQARTACETLLGEAEERGVPTWIAILSSRLAETALRQGDLAAAERLASEALSVLPPRSWGVAIGAPLGTLVTSSVLLGDLDKAADHLQLEVPDAMYQSAHCLGYLRARGCYHLAADGPQVALADFEVCANLMKKWQIDLPGFQDWRSPMAVALVRLGRTEEARKLLDEQLSLADEGDSRVRATALAVLAQTEPPTRRPDLLNRALDLLDPSCDAFSMSMAAMDLSHAFHELGDLEKAHLHKERADRLFSGTREEGRAKRGNGAERAPGNAPLLTKSELRVAELAAQGLTNREISGRLYITVSTVEQHLTHVYRKLNVKNRLALPRVLIEEIDVS